MREEDIKIPAPNVFIKHSNAVHDREWLPDELALQEEVSGSLILSLILQNDCTDACPNSPFKTAITIIQFSGTLSPLGMLKVCEWLSGSGLCNVKYVIKGCHRAQTEESTGGGEGTRRRNPPFPLQINTEPKVPVSSPCRNLS